MRLNNAVKCVVNKYLVYIFASIPILHFLFDCTKGLDFLMYQYLADDAFYYFEISRHIPEFNTGIPNSGFHPLYAFLVSPLHRFLNFDWAIPLSLLLLILCNSVSVVLLYRLLSAYWEYPIPLLCAATWAISAEMYSISMSGVETVLAASIILLFFVQFSSLHKNHFDKYRSFDLLLLGILAGFSFLARMDSPLILAPAMGYLVLKFRRRNTDLCLLVVPAIILPLGWMCYIGIQTGHIFPTSGAAIRVMSGAVGSFFPPLTRIYNTAKVIPAHFIDFFVSVPQPIEIILLAVTVLIGFIGFGLSMRGKSGQVSDMIVFSSFVVGGLILWSAYYVLYQGKFRRWYFGHLAIAVYGVYLPILFRVVFYFIHNRRKALLLSSILIGAFAILSQYGPYAPQEYDKYKSAMAANAFVENMEPGKRVGAFNAGIYDYFMDVDVINLDGVVNPEAMKAMREDKLAEYIQERNIGYLIEHDIGEASNLARIYGDERVELKKWIDLTRFYTSYADTYAKQTFLWKVQINEH